jgi:membrane-associated phospholipid phosphatase
MSDIRPADALIFGFLIFLFIITTIFLNQIPGAYVILLIYAALITILSLLIYFKNRYDSKILEITYDLVFPVIAVLLVFNSMGWLIRYINPITYDHLLIRMDFLIFKVHPTVALERLTYPAITEIMQIAYTSYYFLPVILGVVLKVKGKEKDFNQMLFLVILCFFLSYIGYIIVPAIGPRYTMNHLQSIDLHGIFLRDIIDSALNTIEGVKRDAFPSGHTAVALVILYLSFRFHRSLFRIFLPFVFMLLLSTVYLRYHYVVDVIGGILLFVFTIFIGKKYYDWWERRKK